MITIPQNKLINAVDKLSSIGLVITPDHLQNAIPSKLYRVGTTNKPRGRDGWYKLLHDATLDFVTLLYGNWITQESHKHYINLKDDSNYRKLSPQEYQEQQRQFNARIEAQKTEELKKLESKRNYYVGIYKSLSGVDSHGYLARKGIHYLSSYDLKLDTRNNSNLLCVPFFNGNNEMQGYQTISVSGQKLFNGSVGGNFWRYPVSNPNSKLFSNANSFFILCEGLATGLSAYQAITEYFDSHVYLPIVLCAFNVGNISKVIHATKMHKLPYLYLIDNDSTKPRNAGIETAKSVLETHQDCEIYPLTFSNGHDANDYILEHGNFAFIQKLNQYAKPVINKIFR